MKSWPVVVNKFSMTRNQTHKCTTYRYSKRLFPPCCLYAADVCGSKRYPMFDVSMSKLKAAQHTNIIYRVYIYTGIYLYRYTNIEYKIQHALKDSYISTFVASHYVVVTGDGIRPSRHCSYFSSRHPTTATTVDVIGTTTTTTDHNETICRTSYWYIWWWYRGWGDCRYIAN